MWLGGREEKTKDLKKASRKMVNRSIPNRILRLLMKTYSDKRSRKVVAEAIIIVLGGSVESVE
jgi:hypothetical protein